MKRFLLMLGFLAPMTALSVTADRQSLNLGNEHISFANESGETLELAPSKLTAIVHSVNVSCIPAERNSSGEDQGFIHVLVSSTHIGGSATIEYDTCLDIISAISADESRLQVSWEAGSLSPIQSAKIEWSIED